MKKSIFCSFYIGLVSVSKIKVGKPTELLAMDAIATPSCSSFALAADRWQYIVCDVIRRLRCQLIALSYRSVCW
jgi:hypothetical protein